MKNISSSPYRSYLIRLWPKEREGDLACRATLDSVKTGERYDFATLEDLLTFLREEEVELIRDPDAVTYTHG